MQNYPPLNYEPSALDLNLPPELKKGNPIYTIVKKNHRYNKRDFNKGFIQGLITGVMLPQRQIKH